MRVLTLATADASLRIAPEIGGSLVSFDVAGVPILRPTGDATLAARDVRGVACYPLVPYSNRIRDARLHFAGRTFALARNFGEHPHSIHGVGWQREWQVIETSSAHARLALTHDARGESARAWPWPFDATQAFHLAPGPSRDRHPSAVLVATLTIANTGNEPFPFGLGFHPFFARRAATRLRFHAERVWENDATQLPRSLVALPPSWRFDRGRTLDDVALDNVFVGWDRTATIADESHERTVRIDADRSLGFAVVYAPRAADFVAFEPVTHETDAFNRSAAGASETGTRILAPGGAFSCTMRVAAAVAGEAHPRTSP
jgi:aldose 1-epimerase